MNFKFQLLKDKFMIISMGVTTMNLVAELVHYS